MNRVKFAEPLRNASPKSPSYDIEKGHTFKPSAEEEVRTESIDQIEVNNEPAGTGAAISSYESKTERFATYEARERAQQDRIGHLEEKLKDVKEDMKRMSIEPYQSDKR